MTKESTASPPNPHETRGSNRILIPLRSSHLDRQLASGAPPGWSRSLAARAGRITTPDRLRTLARDWERLLGAARRPAPIRTIRVPLCRDRIIAADAEIRDLLAALPEARLESAAGVAMASRLLRDGSGPLYSRRCSINLAVAVQNATTHIREPATATWAKS